MLVDNESNLDRVPENGSDCGKDDDIEDPTSANKIVKKKTRKRGIIYLSTIPPFMNVAKIREIFSQYGDVARIYLQSTASKFENFFRLG